MRTISSRTGQLVGKILLLALPLIAVLISYIIWDPFRVLYHYTNFSYNLVSIPNRDYISTQMYLNNYEKSKYKSFILGNSRTIAFPSRSWTPYIGDSLSYHFDASTESLFGVWKKLQFIEAHGSEIKNVLLICDASLLEQTHDAEAAIIRKDPRLLGQSPLGFQLSFLRSYLSDYYFYKYIKRRFRGEYTPDMHDVFASTPIVMDSVNNELSWPELEQKIKTDSQTFYGHNTYLANQVVHPKIASAVIGGEQRQQLVAIHNIFKSHNTNYHLIISPLRNQEQLNPADLNYLEQIFGEAHVHDFSGSNEFTRQTGNYYEASHYRPILGRQILRLIYGDIYSVPTGQGR